MREELCQRCQQAFFAQANSQLCDQCAELMFDKVKTYIQENQYNSMGEVAENTDVEYKYIDKWIKSGRLILTSPDAKAIREKLLNFQQQASQLQSNNSIQDKSEEANGPKFHFLKDKKNR